MSITYTKDTSLREALTRVADLSWSRTPHTSAAVYFGNGPFRLGQSTFSRVADLEDRVALARLQLSKKGIDVHPDSYRIILTPHLASFNFSSGASFIHLMSELKGEAMINGTEGSNLVVQVRGKDEFWHTAALHKNIALADRLLVNAGEDQIKRIKHPQEDRVDYVFPTIGSMRCFCDFVQSGNLDAAADVARAHAQAQTPPAILEPALRAG